MGKMDFFKRNGANASESIGRAATGPRLAVGVASAPPSPATVSTADHRRLRQSTSILRDVPIGLVEPDPDQVRKSFDEAELDELRASFEKHGQLQACEVYEFEGRYRIVFGERRYRAAVLAGLSTLSCVILPERPVEKTLRVRQVVENLQREGLKPIEEAEAFAGMMGENGWTGKQLAEELGISASRITKAVALLKLPGEVRASIQDGSLAKSIGYELSKYAPAEAIALAERAKAGGWTGEELTARMRAEAEAAEIASRPDALAEGAARHVAKLEAHAPAHAPAPAPASVRAVEAPSARDDDPAPAPPSTTVRRAETSRGAPPLEPSDGMMGMPAVSGRWTYFLKTPAGGQVTVTVTDGEGRGPAAVEALAHAYHIARAKYGMLKESDLA